MSYSVRTKSLAPEDNPLYRLMRNTRSERRAILGYGIVTGGIIAFMPELLGMLALTFPIIHAWLSRRALNLARYLSRCGMSESLLTSMLDGQDYVQAFQLQFRSAAATTGAVLGLWYIALFLGMIPDFVPLKLQFTGQAAYFIGVNLFGFAALYFGQWFLYWGILSRGKSILFLLPFYVAGYAVVIAATFGIAALPLPIFFWIGGDLRSRECMDLYPERLRARLFGE